MASFGRLEIYRPESVVESYILEQESTAIGRQAGNNLVIDRNGISRYHAVLKINNQQMYLEDLESVNGTYVDGIRLEAHQPFLLRGGEEIQVGDVRLVYHPLEVGTTTAEIRLDRNIQVLESPEMLVHVTGVDMVIIPGSNANASLLLENRMSSSEQFRIEVEGVPPEWVRLERVNVSLEPGQQVQLRCNFKPLRRSDTRPGTYPISFIIEPMSRPAATLRLESSIQVGVYSGYGVVMGTPFIEGGQTLEMHVHNHGNGVLNLSFRGADPTAALNYNIMPAQLSLQGGERRTIQGKIRPQNGRWFGSAHDFTYDIITLSHDASGFQAAVSGRYRSQPLLPGWLPPLGIPLVGLVIVGLLVALLLLTQGDSPEAPPAPQIAAFTVVDAQTEVELGQPLLLEWAVEDAESITLRYSRANQPVQEVQVQPADLNTYQLSLDSTGVYTISLDVENASGQDSQQLIASVIPQIERLEASPNILLRHVAQEVELSWQYRGETRLDNAPDVLLSSAEEEQIQELGLPPRGSRVFTVRPVESFSVSLVVRGNDGTENSTVLQFALEDPQCVLSNPQAALYDGPGESFSVLETITTAGYIINPIARTEDGTWLEVNYADGRAWARMLDFSCEGFQPQQLEEAVNLPPPPARTPSNTSASPTPGSRTTTPPPAATMTPLVVTATPAP